MMSQGSARPGPGAIAPACVVVDGKAEERARAELAGQSPQELQQKKHAPQQPEAAGAASPQKGASKRKAEPSADQAQKKPKPAADGKAAEPWVPPPVVPIEVEERQLKAGTHKAAAFAVLKAAGPAGMSVGELLAAASERGVRQYEGTEAQRKAVSVVLAGDPAFVRVRKGVYALRALMGDAPYESVGRPSKKASKEAAAPASASAAAAAANLGVAPAPTPPKLGPGSPAKRAQQQAAADPSAAQLPAPAAAAPEAAAVPEAAPEEPYVPPPVRSVEEEEARLRPGTNKAIVWAVLKGAGAAGMSIAGIMAAAAEQGLREFTGNQKSAVSAAITTDPAFVRVTRGIYAIRALMGDAPYEAVGRPSKKAQQPKAGTGAAAEGAAAASAAAAPQPGGEQEAQSLTKADQIELVVRRALDARRSALAKARSQQQKAQARLEAAAKEPRTPSKRVHEDALGPPPSFELTREEQRFTGDPSDKTAVAAYKQRIKDLQAQRAAEKAAWQARLAEAREKDGDAAPAGASELVKAQRALKSAQKRASAAAADLLAAEATQREAQRAATKERAKLAAVERREVERKEREAARAAERERKRAEAAKAKRYPMEDLQLLEELRQKAAAAGEAMPAEDVPLPLDWLSPADSEATAGLLFAADFAAQFAKLLRLPKATAGFQELAALLKGGTAPGQASKGAADGLWELYEALLRLALEDAEEGSKERAWAGLLSRGSLGEVLRRYLAAHTHEAAEAQRADLAAAARALEGAPLDSLPGAQHGRLLAFLADQLLAGEALRAALQARIDASGDVRREMREAVAEKKGELKEILEGEKEERRRAREEEAARKAAKKAAKEAAAAAGAAAGSSESAAAEAAAAAAEAAAEPAAAAEAGAAEEQEPSWELPPELQEFSGEEGDRKALLAFRQKQQAARKRLEKQRAAWQAAARQRAAEREAAARAAAEAERAKAKAKAAAEEQVLRQQEAFESELEKLLVRRAPLGSDRRHRRYWHGLAGQRALLHVEDGEGRWAALRSPEQLASLLVALDRRGVREGALAAALEKVQAGLAQAMRRAGVSSGGGGGGEPQRGAADGGRFPRRERAQAELFSPSKEAARKAAAERQTAVEGLEGAALDAVAEQLARLQQGMAGRALGPPRHGWKAWGRPFLQAGRNAQAALAAEGSLAGFAAELKACLVEAEDMLHAAGGPPGADGGGGEEPEAGGRRAPKLWRDTSERAAWRVSVLEGGSLAALALAAAWLGAQGGRLLARLEPPKPAPKQQPAAKQPAQRQGKAARKAEAQPEPEPAPEAAKAAKAGKAATPAARPPTRANPRPAADEAGPSKEAAGTGGKQAAAKGGKDGPGASSKAAAGKGGKATPGTAGGKAPSKAALKRKAAAEAAEQPAVRVTRARAK